MTRLRSAWIQCCKWRWATALLLGLLDAPAQAADSPATARAIFRCTVDGVTTFSDKACAPDAQLYAVDTSRISTYSPALTSHRQPAASKTSQKAAPARQNGSIAGEQARHAAACARVADALRELRSKMRAGYDARQGERLRERQKKLEAKRRAGGCR